MFIPLAIGKHRQTRNVPSPANCPIASSKKKWGLPTKISIITYATKKAPMRKKLKNKLKFVMQS